MKTRIAHIIFSFVLTALFILPSLASADTQLFTRYLQKGDSGTDVILLQKVLNSDKDTQVATSGNGSPGLEIDYFGELTKQAVIKFQKKNGLGNKYGFFTLYSGAVDDKTREALNNLVKNKGIMGACNRALDLSSTQSVLAEIQNMNRRSSILEPENAGGSTSTEERWRALNESFSVSRSNSTTVPYIEKIEIASKSEKDGKDSFSSYSSSMTFKEGDKLKITGCNFATSTPNTIHMTYSDEFATSTNGTIIEFQPKGKMQRMFDEQINEVLDDSDDEDETREKILDKMEDLNKLPGYPVFIIVETSKGSSNPYQAFFNLQ
jgi:peptidoglycan hydrolase-like protein with peptidoglycan-binding domain